MVKGFGSDDPIVAITLLKFINEMLFKAEDDEKKQSVFLAKLEGLGIKEHFQNWQAKSDNEDIQL